MFLTQSVIALILAYIFLAMIKLSVISVVCQEAVALTPFKY